jgi:flavodoxin
MKILVIYYSLTGNTQKIAETIANTLAADIIQIEDKRRRTGTFGMLRAAYQVMFSRPANISFPSTDLYRYDLLIIGTPTWMMKLAPPMRSYILKEKHKFTKVAFFCTEDSSGAANVFKEMQSLCVKKPVATLEITKADLKSGKYKEKSNTFANACCQDVADNNESVTA